MNDTVREGPVQVISGREFVFSNWVDTAGVIHTEALPLNGQIVHMRKSYRRLMTVGSNAAEFNREATSRGLALLQSLTTEHLIVGTKGQATVDHGQNGDANPTFMWLRVDVYVDRNTIVDHEAAHMMRLRYNGAMPPELI